MGRAQRASTQKKKEEEQMVDLNVSTLDTRGRLLQEGDEILLNVQGPIFFRIERITPVLDPTAPKDLLLVSVVARLMFSARRGEINPEFIRVRTVDEVRGPE